jgi:hypothetical protein
MRQRPNTAQPLCSNQRRDAREPQAYGPGRPDRPYRNAPYSSGGDLRLVRPKLSRWLASDRPARRCPAPQFASSDFQSPALHRRGGAAECVRSLIPGALSILKGAVPGRARGAELAAGRDGEKRRRGSAARAQAWRTEVHHQGYSSHTREGAVAGSNARRRGARIRPLASQDQKSRRADFVG